MRNDIIVLDMQSLCEVLNYKFICFIFISSVFQMNMNGKKMEIIVKKVINKMPYNPETLINPESLQYFQNVKELQNF